MSGPAAGRWRDAGRRLVHAALAALLPGGLRLFGILSRVDGFLYPQEAVFLHRLARDAPGAGRILEVGSYCGLSTLCLATGARRHAEPRVTAVDPQVRGAEARLRANLRRFGMTDRVEVVVATSLETAARWSGPLRVVFIDGSHELESVRADLAAWLPHVEPGGFLVLHDSTALSSFPGPVEVAREQLREGPVFEAVGRVGSMTWARRRGAPSNWRPTSPGGRALDALFGGLQRWRIRRSTG